MQTLEAKSQVCLQVDWPLRLPRARPQTAETGPASSLPWGRGPFTQQKLLFCAWLRMAATFSVLSWGCCGQATAGAASASGQSPGCCVCSRVCGTESKATRLSGDSALPLRGSRVASWRLGSEGP